MNKKLPNLGLAKISKRFSNWKQNLDIVFIVLLLLLLAAEGWVVKDSITLVLNFNNTPQPITKTKQVSIDFMSYNAAVEHIQNGQYYVPTTTPLVNPFGIPGKQPRS